MNSTNVSNTDLSFSSGLGLLLGFNYQISSKINISAEVMPSISYSFTKSSSDFEGTIYKSKSNAINYGLRTNGVNLTISFNIGK
jgi:hypothetical protein